MFYLIKKIIRHKMRRIQSKNQKIKNQELMKLIISLSCFDDKRCVLDDGIHTLAYFHKDLKKQIFTNGKSKKFLTDKKDLIDDHR